MPAVVTYTNNRTSVDKWCQESLERAVVIGTVDAAQSIYMGLDTETKPSLFPGDIAHAPGLLQLALRCIGSIGRAAPLSQGGEDGGSSNAREEQCSHGHEYAVLLFALCHFDGAHNNSLARSQVRRLSSSW